MSGKGQILVRSASSHHTAGCIKEYFKRSRKESTKGVEKTERGFVVTFSNFLAAWSVALQDNHQLDDVPLQVELLQSNVYDCEINITPGQVEINVGADVLNTIIQDRNCLKSLDKKISLRCGKVWWRLPCHLQVSCTSSEKWSHWEKYMLNGLIELLSPFKHQLPENIKQQSAGLLFKLQHFFNSKASQQQQTEGGANLENLKPKQTETDADASDDVVVGIFVPFGFQFFQNKLFVYQLTMNHPELEICFDTKLNVIQFSGPENTVETARQYLFRSMEQLSVERIAVTTTMKRMFEKTDAQTHVQEKLALNVLACFWEITSSSIVITATSSDHASLKQMFQTFFKESKIPVSQNQIPSLESAAWSTTMKNLRKKRDGQPRPELQVDVSGGEISIVDLPTNMESSRRSVIEFFYNYMVQENKICDQLVEETITNLKPWQTNLFRLIQVRQKLCKDLQTIAASFETNTTPHELTIKAPIHLIDRLRGQVWQCIASLCQKEISLTKASSEMYKQPAAKTWVQKLLDKKGLLCHWEIEEGRIVVSAPSTDQQQVKQTIVSAFTETTIAAAKHIANLLHSEEWQSFMRQKVEQARSGYHGLIPVFQSGTSGDCVIIVDVPGRIAVSKEAVISFFKERVYPHVRQTDKGRDTQRNSSDRMTEDIQMQTEDKEKTEEVRQMQIQTEDQILMEQERQMTVEDTQSQVEYAALQAEGRQTHTEDKPIRTEEDSQLEEISLNAAGSQIQAERRLILSPEHRMLKQTRTEERQVQKEDIELQAQEGKTSEYRQLVPNGSQPVTAGQGEDNSNCTLEEHLEHAALQSVPVEITPDVDTQTFNGRSPEMSEDTGCSIADVNDFDRWQTFPKTVVESQIADQGSEAPAEDSHGMDVWTQQLSWLDSDQLIEISTHLGVSQRLLLQLQSRSADVESFKKNLIEQCITAADTNKLLTVLFLLVAKHAASADRAEDPQLNQRNWQMMQYELRQSLSQMEAQIHQRFSDMEQRLHQTLLQRECVMQERLDALIQYRLQSANEAETRVYMRQMQAMQTEMQTEMQTLQAEMRGEIADAVDEVRQEIDTDVHGMLGVDNASETSSSTSALSSAVHDQDSAGNESERE